MRVVIASLVLVLGGCAAALAQTGDGYVGVYADAAGTQPCATVDQFATLYVIAKVGGATGAGITGAEFRIEVDTPSGWQFNYSPPPAANIVMGNPIDMDPMNAQDGSGLRIAFPTCQTPAGGQVGLGTLSVYRGSEAPPTHLLVKAHSVPSNTNYPCPLFTICDSLVYSKFCMSTAGESCSLNKPSATHTVPADRVFATGINVENLPPRSMTGTELVEALREERRLAVNFVFAPNEHSVPLLLGQPISDIIGQLEAASGEYRHRTINGRLVIYPVSSALEDTVQLPPGEFQNVPRYPARSDYILWLRAHHPAFSTLQPPISVTTGKRSATDERISLTPRAPVLQHLVELLGSNPHRVFTIEPNAALRAPILNFRLISDLSGSGIGPSKAQRPRVQDSGCASGLSSTLVKNGIALCPSASRSRSSSHRRGPGTSASPVGWACSRECSSSRAAR